MKKIINRPEDYTDDMLRGIYAAQMCIRDRDKAIKNEEFGVVTWNVLVLNQNDEPVLFHVDKQYIGRKPAAAEEKEQSK